MLILALILAIGSSAFAQERKLISKINVLGIGYGLEYFISPLFSWHNEIGLSLWEKIDDRIQNEQNYSEIAALNPYFNSSLRYYFVPVHPVKNGKFDIGWRISASYTGLYTSEKFMEFSGKNIQRLGIFAGTNIYFSKLLYFELELGPGYAIDNFKNNRVDLFGNVGLGFTF